MAAPQERADVQDVPDGDMPRRIDVIRRGVVDVGEPIPRRWVQRVGHQAIGSDEPVQVEVIEPG